MTIEDAVSTACSKSQIEFVLFRFGQDVRVSGSRMTEDGYDLVLSGPETQVRTVIECLEGDAHERIWNS